MLTVSRSAATAPGITGCFPTDRDCAFVMFNPWLEWRMGEGHPLVFQFEARKDLRMFLRRLHTFERRGYRVVEETAA